ncbi:MAG: DUF1499 domain-containing protein [bacterium]
MAEVHRVPRRSTLASLAFIVSFLIGISALGFTLSVRTGYIHFKTGFSILRFCVYGAGISGVMALAGVWITFPLRSNTRGFTLSITAALISALVIWFPVSTWMNLREKPPVHDVTTNWKKPPQFKVISKFRSSDDNPIPDKPSYSRKVRKAYSDLSTIELSMAYTDCFKQSMTTVRRLEWTIGAANWNEGRIEAVDRTFWFGFKDDIAIRITSDNADRCRIDLRSVSRVGQGDGGRNAQRIKTFKRTLLQGR